MSDEAKAPKSRINAGCGVHTVDDPLWENCDKFPAVAGVRQVDFEQTPWPWADNSIDAILFNHSLEHMGQQPAVFLAMMQEIYRVCRHDARILVNAPHPRHDEFIGDPTHVRIVTADMFVLFSKKANQAFRDQNGANSCFAFQLGVDFEVVKNELVLDDRFKYLQDDPSWTRVALTQNNVIKETRLEIRVVKDAQ